MDRTRLRGVALVLFAALSTACMGVFVKEALDRGAGSQTLLTIRYTIVGLSLGLAVLLRGALPHGFAARRRALLVGICMFFGGSFEIHALSVLPLGVVIVILFLAPLWIAIYSRLFRGERLDPRRRVAFALVFAGILCLVGPAFGDYDIVGLLCALGSSLVWAAILLSLQGTDEGREVSAPALIGTSAAIAGVISILVEPQAFATEFASAERVPWLLAVGATAALGFGLLALGVRGQLVFDVAVVSSTEPLFAVLLGAVFLDERLSAVQLLGVLSVAIGVVLIAASEGAEGGSAGVAGVDGEQGWPGAP